MMVYKCAAINCRSGYDGESKDSNVTFHAFPLHDQQLLQAWHKRLARKDFIPQLNIQNSSQFILFMKILSQNQMIKVIDRKERESTKLIRRCLKNDAHPTIFINLPSYCTNESEPRHSGLSSSTSYHENEVARLEDCCESFLNADKL